nr:hypothetical protein [Desulfosarcina cetonica]
MDQSIEQVLARKTQPGQNPGRQDAQGQTGGHGPAGDPQAQPQGLQLNIRQIQKMH